MNLDIKDIHEFRELIHQFGFRLSDVRSTGYYDYYYMNDMALMITRPDRPSSSRWQIKIQGVIQAYSHSCVTAEYKLSDIRLLKRLFKKTIRDIRINSIL